MFKKTGIKSKNIPLMFAMEVIGGMIFFLPILSLYFEASLFSITNIAIIFSVEAICIVCFEVPTGAIADLFGRKKALIFAQLFVLLGIVFLAIGGSMVMFILFAVFNAFARSLTSGTYSAFLYDTLKEEDKEVHFKKVYGTLLSLWPLGAAVSSVIGGYLAKTSLSLPVLVTLLPITIVFILSLFLKEPQYEKEGHRNVGRHMLTVFKTVVNNRQLLLLLVASFVMMSLGDAVHFLEPLFFRDKGIPIVFFGYISALILGFVSLGNYSSHYLSEKFGNKQTLILILIFFPLLILMATVSTGYTLIALYTIPQLFYGMKAPIIDHLINKEVSSSKRATVLSLYNFTGYLGMAIATPFIGYYSDIFSITTAIQLTSILLLIVPILFVFIKDRK